MATKAIKGLDSDFKCRGHQFEVGKTYTVTGKIEACLNGFHAVESCPLDVWEYYPVIGENGMLTRYADTVHMGNISRDGSKIASASITIAAELVLPVFIKRAVDWIVSAAGEKASGDNAKLAASGYNAKLAASGYSAKLAASGDNAKLAASGSSAQLAASGDNAKLAASGYNAKLAASGYSAKLAASGSSAKLAASGYNAQLAASGDNAKLAASGSSAKLAASGSSAQLAASGDDAKLAASGDNAQLAASGSSAQLASEGKNSVIASSAPNTIASGAYGTWISLAWFKDGVCAGFATGCIGKKGLKPGVAYEARDGKLVEYKP